MFTSSEPIGQGHDEQTVRRIVTIQNIRIAVSLASTCTAPDLKALHLRSARAMLTELQRQVAQVAGDVEALEREAVRAAGIEARK